VSYGYQCPNDGMIFAIQHKEIVYYIFKLAIHVESFISIAAEQSRRNAHNRGQAGTEEKLS